MIFKGIPKPRNDRELELLTLWYFGMELHVDFSIKWGVSYQVKEAYKVYHGDGFAYSTYSCEGHDSSGWFWDFVIGKLSCGGIATNSYGQCKDLSHRDMKRLEKWLKKRGTSWNRNPREVFVRLARNVGAGEKAQIRGVRHLSSVRVDGAEAVYNAN